MGTGNNFNTHRDRPQGPNGGNIIDLTQTGEGDAVLRTRIEELGHAVLSGEFPAVAESYPAQDSPEGVTVTPGEPTAPVFDPSVYKKDPFQ